MKRYDIKSSREHIAEGYQWSAVMVAFAFLFVYLMISGYCNDFLDYFICGGLVGMFVFLLYHIVSSIISEYRKIKRIKSEPEDDYPYNIEYGSPRKKCNNNAYLQKNN